jgi:hypothetical protein
MIFFLITKKKKIMSGKKNIYFNTPILFTSFQDKELFFDPYNHTYKP